MERSNLTPRGRTAAPAGADPATPTEADPRTAEAGAATSRRAAILLGLGAAAGAFAAIAGVRLAERTGDGRREITAAGGLLPDGPLSTGSAWSGRRRREAGWSSRTAAPDSATGGSSTAGPSAPEPASPGGRSATGPKSTPLGTAGPSGSSPAPANALQFFGSAENRQVYLTIDDGWFPDARVVDLIRAERLPITTFLIANAGDEDPERLAFWRSFVDAGGVVENHTVSHPWLTRLRPGEIEAQWEGASTAFAKWFGRRPTLGRPPYGAVDDPVWTAAENAGLTTLVMWSAVDDGHGVATWNHRPLAAGDIVLMHWDPGLFRELQQVLAAISDAGLRPAFLSPA